MTKLFIDVVGSERRHLDFSGRLFLRAEEAAELARLISLDLSVSEDSPWVGSAVQVKDEVGRCLFTCPVRQMQ